MGMFGGKNKFRAGDKVWVKNRKFAYDNPQFGTKGIVSDCNGHMVQVKLVTSGQEDIFDESNVTGTGSF